MKNYKNFLSVHLPELIILILEETRNNIIFKHVGCSEHYWVNVRQMKIDFGLEELKRVEKFDIQNSNKLSPRS